MSVLSAPKFMFEATFYPDITEDDRIDSEAFLAACHVIVDFLDMMGKIFMPVRADINGHIERVKKLVVTDTAKFRHLDAIVDPAVTVDNKDKRKRNDAILSLTWLKRSCEFIHHFLYSFSSPDNLTREDLKPFLREAYELYLKAHHNIVTQKLVQVCFHAAPSRESMIDVLSGKGERSSQQVYNIMRIFLVNMRINADALIRTFDRFAIQQ